MRVFIDSDVVISSLISSTGAAHFLTNQSQIQPVVSSLSLKELRLVVKRMDIPLGKLELFISNHFELYKITKQLNEVQQEYKDYVTDINDAHIVAGAHDAKVKFLISYNLKHFKTDKIKDELDVLLLTPALFLQYLRSH